MSFQSKYFFESNVRLDDGSVATQQTAYDTLKDAEIKYHDEVSYGLKLNNIVLAHYKVTDEFGAVWNNLEKTINNIPTEEIL